MIVKKKVKLTSKLRRELVSHLMNLSFGSELSDLKDSRTAILQDAYNETHPRFKALHDEKGLRIYLNYSSSNKATIDFSPAVTGSGLQVSFPILPTLFFNIRDEIDITMWDSNHSADSNQNSDLTPRKGANNYTRSADQIYILTANNTRIKGSKELFMLVKEWRRQNVEIVRRFDKTKAAFVSAVEAHRTLESLYKAFPVIASIAAPKYPSEVDTEVETGVALTDANLQEIMDRNNPKAADLARAAQEAANGSAA